MMITALILAFAPLACGLVAFIVAAVLAAYRVAAIEAAPFVPEYTANETAEWIDALSLELDVDAEWCALADASVCGHCGEAFAVCDHAVCEAETVAFVAALARITPVCVDCGRTSEACTAVKCDLILPTLSQIAATFRAERAAVDAWIDARPAAAPKVSATRMGRASVMAAHKRIVARVVHTSEAITLTPETLGSARKLTSAAAFVAEAKRAIAAHTARRTLDAYYMSAFTREMRDAFTEGYTPVCECPENAAAAAYDGLGTLATLARMRGDAPEAAAIEACETSAHLAALAAA